VNEKSLGSANRPGLGDTRHCDGLQFQYQFWDKKGNRDWKEVIVLASGSVLVIASHGRFGCAASRCVALCRDASRGRRLPRTASQPPRAASVTC